MQDYLPAPERPAKSLLVHKLTTVLMVQFYSVGGIVSDSTNQLVQKDFEKYVRSRILPIVEEYLK